VHARGVGHVLLDDLADAGCGPVRITTQLIDATNGAHLWADLPVAGGSDNLLIYLFCRTKTIGSCRGIRQFSPPSLAQ
jgi:hypothetical protein